MFLKRSFYLVILLGFLAGCSPYQKALRSDDVGMKYKLAEQYYKKGDYQRAVAFYDELITMYKGTSQEEDVYFKYAYCYYHLGEFLLSSFHFKFFAESFPLNPNAEEAFFMYAYSLYQQSPSIDLDQASTKKAIDAFQLFIDKYPESKKVEESNKHIDELNAKIEQKALRTALLYYKIEDYKSASWALKQYITDYPSSSRKEEIEFMIVKSSYELAVNSVEQKKEERFLNTLQYCADYKDKYPSSKYLAEVGSISHDATYEIQKLKSKSHE